jgi:uncharacterized membrane protein
VFFETFFPLSVSISFSLYLLQITANSTPYTANATLPAGLTIANLFLPVVMAVLVNSNKWKIAFFSLFIVSIFITAILAGYRHSSNEDIGLFVAVFPISFFCLFELRRKVNLNKNIFILYC